jgi:hypothetical protein
MTDTLPKPEAAEATAIAREYPLGVPQQNEYRVFPDELENDPDIFFHGTEERVLQAIRDEGFRFPDRPRAQSVSFSRVSSLALGYASGKRSNASPNGVVIAVRFAVDNRSVRREQAFGLHVDRFDPQPEIVGYCIVPASYVHH